MPLYLDHRASEVVLTADVPGAKRDDLSIEFCEDGWLSIRGRAGNREYSSGCFLAGIDAQKAHAECHDGVLTIRIPRTVAKHTIKVI